MQNEIHEECGVFGIYDKESRSDVAANAYYALYRFAAPGTGELRHCGQRQRGDQMSIRIWAWCGTCLPRSI